MIETLVIVLPLMVSPGPANLASFVLAARHGISKVIPFVLGIVSVYVTIAFATGVFSKQLFVIAPRASGILATLGGTFIIFLGIQLMLRERRQTQERRPTLFEGAALQCLNPKYPGVVMTVYAERSHEPALLVALAISVVGTISLLAYAAMGALLSKRKTTPKQRKLFDQFAGGMLCLVGLWLILKSVANAAVP